MMRSLRRLFLKVRLEVSSFWSKGSTAQSRLFVCGFIVLGIFAFASLHAVINVVAVSHHYSEVGYFDLYGENLTSCWGGSFVGQSTSAWTSSLNHLGLSTAVANSEQDNGNSIRLSSRPVYTVNQTGPYPALHAGHCIEVESQYSYLRPFLRDKVTCYPSFAIIGAMKCGTGELMKWLELHPFLRVISGSSGKRESHFFTREMSIELRQNPRRSDVLREYGEHLPALTTLEASQIYTFEKSPDYLRNTKALEMLQNYLPSLRVVAILRNPIYRALSEFSHHCRHRRYIRLLERVEISSKGSKGSVITYPKGSVLRIVDHTNRDRNTGHNHTHNPYTVDILDLPLKSYVRLRQPCSVDDMATYFRPLVNVASRSVGNESNRAHGSATPLPDEILNGLYDQQLEKLYKIFSPSRVLILLQEDMFRNTYRTLRRIESFLGIPCYDYSKVAYTPDPDSPPIRKAQTVTGKLREYMRSLLNVFVGSYAEGMTADEERRSSSIHHLPGSTSSTNSQHGPKSVLPSSTGEKLFKKSPKTLQTWLLQTYAPHNRRLVEIMREVHGWQTSNSSGSPQQYRSSGTGLTATKGASLKQPVLDFVDAHWNL